MTKRAAHTAVYVNHTDSLYVFGGYDLNKVLGLLEVYRLVSIKIACLLIQDVKVLHILSIPV